MSSDSSEDENLEILREATDNQFINDSMYKCSDNRQSVSNEKEIERPPSLRRVQDEDDQFKLFNVTPQFQNYVAKALSKKLEEYLEKNLKTNNVCHKKRKKIRDCIKLLKFSKHPIDIHEAERENGVILKNTLEHNRNFKKIQHKKCHTFDESELKSITVTAEEILSQKEITHWSNRSKAPIYKYIKDETGCLNFIQPDFK